MFTSLFNFFSILPCLVFFLYYCCIMLILKDVISIFPVFRSRSLMTALFKLLGIHGTFHQVKENGGSVLQKQKSNSSLRSLLFEGTCNDKHRSDQNMLCCSCRFLTPLHSRAKTGVSEKNDISTP